ncbi:MAG: hypothetical protein HKM93_08750 [Desulfobacteraceae bacterium]|nr:hypothetical protein [Desulfobacteraceae bacterium]
MEHVIDIMKELMENLTEVTRSEVVVGKTVQLGAHKIVPLTRVSVGFGGGGGEGEGDGPHGKRKNRCDNGKGIGGGAGGGAKVRPVGVIIFGENDVRVEGIPDKKNALDKVFDKVPDLIDMAKSHCQGK